MLFSCCFELNLNSPRLSLIVTSHPFDPGTGVHGTLLQGLLEAGL